MGSTAFYVADPAAAEPAALEAMVAYVDACKAAGARAFIDTAHVYGHPSGAHNEALVGKVLARVGREHVFLATKCGIVTQPAFSFDSSDATIRAQLAESLARLGTDRVDLYYQHRVDPSRPMAEVAGTFRALVREGKVLHVGLSECTPAELAAFHAVQPVAAVQLEWSLHTRDAEAALVPACRALGVAVVCYSPLGRGLLAGGVPSREALAPSDWRLAAPRFAPENLAANAAAAQALAALAAKRGATPAQLALAWLLAQGRDVFVIPGSKSAARVAENLAAAALALSPAEVAEAGAAVPEAKGERYTGMVGTFNSRV